MWTRDDSNYSEKSPEVKVILFKPFLLACHTPINGFITNTVAQKYLKAYFYLEHLYPIPFMEFSFSLTVIFSICSPSQERGRKISCVYIIWWLTLLLSLLTGEMGSHKVWLIPHSLIHRDKTRNAIPTFRQDIHTRNVWEQ